MLPQNFACTCPGLNRGMLRAVWRHPTMPVKRILLVEDDAEVCDVLTFLLGKEG